MNEQNFTEHIPMIRITLLILQMIKFKEFVMCP